MGFFDMFGAQGAYDQVDNEQRPPHEMTHELLAGAAGFEAMDDPSIVELVAQMEKYTKIPAEPEGTQDTRAAVGQASNRLRA